MKTQNGRSQRPLAPASWTHCKHQLTLIKKKKKRLQISLSPPGGGARIPQRAARGERERGAPESQAEEKMGKVT